MQILDDEVDDSDKSVGLTQQQKDLLDHRRATESAFLSVEEVNLKQSRNMAFDRRIKE